MNESGSDPHAGPTVLPWDDYNRQLVNNVHPLGWKAPIPPHRYHLVVIGAGTAGLVSAAGAAGLGARVALIERHLMGGDCLNVGCVPSKALVRAGRAAADVRDAQAYGVEIDGPGRVNFPVVMERMRRLRSLISPADSAERFRQLGVDVYFGQASFTGQKTVQVNNTTLRFKKAILATGARAAPPDIPGLDETGYLTNETVFSLTALPSRLAVIGAGPIGCELAQAFARFGSQVYLIEAQHGILPNEERDAAQLVLHAMQRDGVRLLCCGKQLRVRRTADGKQVIIDSHDQHHEILVDEILVGVGRAPNIEGLDLEAGKVGHDERGVIVDDRLRTTNPRIYAAGDICSRYKFTHAADAMARIAIQNALFSGRARMSRLTIPWCTYTDPEVAHVGLYEKEAHEAGIATDVLEHRFHELDRAILDGEENGYLRVLVRRGTDRLVGATMVARHAGDMISELTLAMAGNLGLKTIARTIHAYPTQSEAIKKVADAYNRRRLTPRVAAILKQWFAWTQ